MASLKAKTKKKEVRKEVAQQPQEKKVPLQQDYDNENIVKVYAKMKSGDVCFEVPKNGLLRGEGEQTIRKIRFNFQKLNNKMKQAGFGSYYLDTDKFLYLVSTMLNGSFDKLEERSRADKSQYPVPIYQDEKPSTSQDEYRYFTVLPGQNEGKIILRYICRDVETNKQKVNIMIPFSKEDFIGKMLLIATQLK